VSKRISLETWLVLTYGDDAPTLDTARRWAREGKIYPKPEKHGRAYFVVPEARYTARLTLLDRLRAETAQAG
jgi:hypothetical protein